MLQSAKMWMAMKSGFAEIRVRGALPKHVMAMAPRVILKPSGSRPSGILIITAFRFVPPTVCGHPEKAFALGRKAVERGPPETMALMATLLGLDTGRYDVADLTPAQRPVG
jgi:hypothetical protein